MGDSKKRSYNKGSYNKSNYYAHSQKKKKVLSLEPGMQGFFCTCNFQEKNCVREAYNILNEYADKLYGPEKGIPDDTQDGDNNDVQNDEPAEEADISDELEKQISDIKSSGKKFNRFQSVFTAVQNCIFIKSNNIEDPVKLGYSIIEDIAATKLQKTRFLLRLVPIEATCSVKIEDIISTAGKLFDRHFLGEPTTFSIVFNRRYNNSISRDVVIKALAELVVSKNCEHKADLTKAKLAVIVEVIKGICLLGVVPNYFQNKKYNLFEICAPPEEKVIPDEKKENSDMPQETKNLE